MRFATVVQKAGKPDIHLLLIEPEKDVSLQRAIKANRVMTLHQTKSADFGVIGFEKGVSGQILVFPKSLKTFEGSRIVGVKYDLLKDVLPPKLKKGQGCEKPRGKSSRKALAKSIKVELPPPEKVVAFTQPEPEHEEKESQRVLDLEGGIHQAMELLDGGRQVAAFNILKRLVE